MRDYIEKACEEIDAAIFSGDAFDYDSAARAQMVAYLDSWKRELTNKDQQEREEAREVCGSFKDADRHTRKQLLRNMKGEF